MRWELVPGGDLALDLTLQSGQAFHWEKTPQGYWVGLIGEIPVRAREDGGRLFVNPGAEKIAAHYFALDHPLEEIYAAFPNDSQSRQALHACRGLRILRQPLWECLATFITSSMKQVAHIRAMSLALRAKFGTPVQGYPQPHVLAQSDELSLRACGLGYRAKHLLAVARGVEEGCFDLEGWRTLNTADLRCALVALPGVGVKVANCVLLFAYERLDAVPIDVWIGRVLLQMRGGRRGTASQLARYAHRRLGPYAGYVQQYLFHVARVSPKIAT